MSFDLSSDYFRLFGLPVSFDIDTAQLTSRFRDLQQTIHPDRFASASEQERRLSLQYATRVNEAYRILRDPLERARYLLELKGVAWEDEQSTLNDPVFLMEQMELREALAEVREQPDPLDAIAGMLTDVNGRIGQGTAQLQALLADDTEENLLQARQEIRKMQFLYKLRSEAESTEAELEDQI